MITGVGGTISLNNYGISTATIEKLNVESNIDTVLKETNLYRNNAYKLKDGVIVLDWE